MIIEDNGLYENIEFINDFGHDGKLIFKAGTTCYRSEDKTTKTVDNFIDMFLKSKHMSMLEMMWIPIVIKHTSLTNKDKHSKILIDILNMNKFIKFSSNDDSILASGNARAWRELFLLLINTKFDKLNQDDDEKIIIQNLLVNFVCFNSRIFNFSEYIPGEIYITAPFFKITILKNNSEIPNDFPQHKWIFVKYTNVSRGLTHELVRHRVMSFAQASTRYIDNSNFNVLFNFEDGFSHLSHFKKFFLKRKTEIIVNMINALYSSMIKNKVQKNYARQLLPTGILNEICVAGRISDWEHVFELRTSTAAHWEIRKIAILTQKIFNINGF